MYANERYLYWFPLPILETVDIILLGKQQRYLKITLKNKIKLL